VNKFQKIVLAIATLCLGFLLWRINAAEVWGYLRLIGAGMILILVQEIVPHISNAIGWRFAFAPSNHRAYSLVELVRLRIAGDGVNYLTPSATIAGEVYRAVALPPTQPTEVRYASVSVAKVSQAVAQIVFILAGLAFIIASHNPIMGRYGPVIYWIAGLMAGAFGFFTLAGILVWRFFISREPKAGVENERSGLRALLAGFGDVPRQSLTFIVEHPVRFVVSAAFFVGGYAWSSVEGLMICRFLGVPITFLTALIIEILSNVIDSLMFMVPAKVGTQEAGKTAIFLGLGLKPTAGFAFGVVRHIREVAWGAFGLFLCYQGKRKSPHAGSRSTGAPSASEPVAPLL
jgi:hypothetical protein